MTDPDQTFVEYASRVGREKVSTCQKYQRFSADHNCWISQKKRLPCQVQDSDYFLVKTMDYSGNHKFAKRLKRINKDGSYFSLDRRHSEPLTSGGFFPGRGEKVKKLHFSLSKLRKQPFFAKNASGKCHISKFRVWQDRPAPLLTPSPPSSERCWCPQQCLVSKVFKQYILTKA